MKNNLYKNIDTFMIRTPTFSVDKFFEFFNEEYDNKKNIDYIRSLCKNPVFRECILISSRSLYSTLIDFSEGKDIKKLDYFLQSIYKYLTRISTRPTPFGLFSGVDFGNYTNDKTTLKYSDNKYKKYVRPDIEWLIKLVKHIEDIEYMNLNYRKNDSILIKGERVFLLYSTEKNEEINENANDSNIEEISIKLTGSLELILQLTQNTISYKDLLQKLIDNYGSEYEQTIEAYLKNLIKNEYLISNLMPPLTVDDQLDYIINEIDRLNIINGLKNQLIEIKNLIKEYMETDLGQGEEIYINLCSKMKNIVSCKSILQVDMKLNLEEKTMNSKVIDEINDLVNMILTISTPFKDRDSYFKRYKQQFIERYGEDREVSLLEMLDNDRGIGAPIGYKYPPTNRVEQVILNNQINRNLKTYFEYKYIDAIKNKKSIVINDKEIKNLQLPEYSYDEAPNSLELNLMIKSNSKENEQNNLKYYIGPNLGSNYAGKSFGRFSYMMQDEKNCFSTVAKSELDIFGQNNYITCELVYLPNKVRVSNVSRNIHGSDYEIALCTNSSKDDKRRISLDDIFIGIENNKFYAKSKSLNKRLIITINNMLNIDFAPNAIKFLSDINQDGKRFWYEFPWNNIFNNSIYIPKIEYKNFTISPSIWKFDKEILGVNKKTSFDKFKDIIGKYFDKYDVPKYVYLTSGDNRTLLNAKDLRSLEILQHEINNKDEVILNSYEDEEFNIVKDKEQKEYFCELVVPLLKVKKEQPKIQSTEIIREDIPSLSEERLKLPFDQWLYLKLYGVASNIEDLISFDVSRYCEEKVSKGDIDKYFFMRYADPVPHLRLRLNAPREKLLELYPEIQDWLKSLMEKGLMNRYVIDSYDREVERYGGSKLMDVAENLFYFDSIVVEAILREQRLNNLNFTKEFIGMVSIIHYIENYGVEYDKQVEFLRSQIKSSDYREDFNKNRKEYMELCNSNNNWENLRATEEGTLLLNILNKRWDIVKNYSEKINKSLKDIEKYSILDSIIHLHCNRLFGIDREFEIKVRALASHALYSLKYFKKNNVQIEK